MCWIIECAVKTTKISPTVPVLRIPACIAAIAIPPYCRRSASPRPSRATWSGRVTWYVTSTTTVKQEPGDSNTSVTSVRVLPALSFWSRHVTDNDNGNCEELQISLGQSVACQPDIGRRLTARCLSRFCKTFFFYRRKTPCGWRNFGCLVWHKRRLGYLNLSYQSWSCVFVCLIILTLMIHRA